MMKKILAIAFVVLALSACSKSPLARLKSCHMTEKESANCSEKEHAFWQEEYKRDPVLWKEAVAYCKSDENTGDNPLCSYTILAEQDNLDMQAYAASGAGAIKHVDFSGQGSK